MTISALDFARVFVPVALFFLGALLGVLRWLLQKHEANIVASIREAKDQIEKLEDKMEAYEDDRKTDLERIHQIELCLARHDLLYLHRTEFETFKTQFHRVPRTDE